MTDLRTQLQTALAASYRLERELGRGGMATVFLAQDLRHDRRCRGSGDGVTAVSLSGVARASPAKFTVAQ